MSANQPRAALCETNLFDSVLAPKCFCAHRHLTHLCSAALLPNVLFGITSTFKRSQAPWLTPQPALERLRPEDPKFKVRMGCVERPF